HDLVERAVAHHTELAWVRLYVSRWLRAPVERPDGILMERTKGTPQGGVVSPLLANLFLHYAFDMWMARTFPTIHFERFADDIIVHCRSEAEAGTVLEAIRGRLAECGLELHSTKTETSTARMTIGRGSTIRSSSTSWDIRSSLDARRTGGEGTL